MMNSHFTQAVHYVRKCNAEEAAKLKVVSVPTTDSPVVSASTSSSALRSLFRKVHSQGHHRNENAATPLSPASSEREQNKALWHRQLVVSQSLHARGLSRR